MTAAQLARRTREPLTKIRRLADRILKTAELDSENRERAQKILRQAGRTDSQWEEFISYALLPQPEVREIDLGALIDRVLLELDEEIRAAQIPVIQEIRGVRVEADENMLARMLRQVIQRRLDARAPGEPLRFLFERLGESGRLRVVDRSRTISHPVSAADSSPDALDELAFAWAERLAEHQDLTLQIEEGGDDGTLVRIDGLRLASEQ